jgi:hypothetical protein
MPVYKHVYKHVFTLQARAMAVASWQMSDICHGVGHAINENKGVRLLPPANQHVFLPGHAEIG